MIRLLFETALLPSSCLVCDRRCSGPLCDGCLALRVPGDHRAAFQYTTVLPRLIQQAKYENNGVARSALCAWVAERAPTSVAANLDAITFVPSSWRRRMWRGFDLPAALAAALGTTLNKPVVDLLRCTRNDARQAPLLDKTARLAAPQGRFAPRQARGSARLLLVDDVWTTGATLQAAADALGANVQSWALAINDDVKKLDEIRE
jgi:predicted amidophosphoribosyltransferase